MFLISWQQHWFGFPAQIKIINWKLQKLWQTLNFFMFRPTIWEGFNPETTKLFFPLPGCQNQPKYEIFPAWNLPLLIKSSILQLFILLILLFQSKIIIFRYQRKVLRRTYLDSVLTESLLDVSQQAVLLFYQTALVFILKWRRGWPIAL